jgi:hypothetical protein
MTCGVCSDRRVVEKPDGTFRPCVCAIQDKVKECLYEFADANLNRKISYEKLHRNMVIRKSDISRFRDLAKTYLTHRVVRTMDFELDHINCCGSEITEAYFNNHEVLTFSYIMNVPILFLRLGKDYSNKGAKEWIPYIVNLRAENPKLITWVYVYPETSDAELNEKYSEQLLINLSTNNYAVVK